LELNIQILGTNSAVPFENRFPSSQVLQNDNDLFLIDCGEGTQYQLSKYSIKRSKINHVFISHLHGDHIFGLPGLLTSYSLFSREQPLSIHGPRGIKDFLECIFSACSIRLSYELEIMVHQTEEPQLVYEDGKLKVYTIPLQHRVPTTGYLFRQKELERNVLKGAIRQYDLTIDQILAVKEGRDIVIDDKIVPFEQFTKPPQTPKSFAYVSDTVYFPEIVSQIQNVDLLYHESTFLEELAPLAAKRMHATAKQAAQIAKSAKVGKLILGHYSSRYPKLQVFLDEARPVFKNTDLAIEGEVFSC